MASSLLAIRAGDVSVGMLIELPILLSSSHGTHDALTTAVSLAGWKSQALTIAGC